MEQANCESIASAPEVHPVSRGGLADVESARAALPKAAFSMDVFEALEKAKAYVGALNIMSCDEDLDGRFSKPMWRLICDVSDLLEKIEQELTKVYNLARRASGLPDLPDDGNGEVEEAAGDVGADAELIALGEQMKDAWAVEREAYARDCSIEEGNPLHLACSKIARQIENTKATTVAGLRVKAAAVDWCCAGKPFAEDDDTTDKRLVTSLLADLQAMTAAA